MDFTSRQEKILSGVNWINTLGLEFGALDNPTLKKSQANIKYVDYATTSELLEKYKFNPHVKIDEICEVDYPIGSDSLLSSGFMEKFDYIIGSHILEHVPDLIGWLKECNSLLSENGVIALALPDRRFTFDHLRNPTKLSEIYGAHVREARIPSPEQILDFFMNFSPIEASVAWEHYITDGHYDKNFEYNLTSTIPTAADAFANGIYHDVHCWVFSPEEFCEIMLSLVQENFTLLGCKSFQTTDKNDLEFFCTMENLPFKEAVESWHEQLKIEQKTSDQYIGSTQSSIVSEIIGSDQHLEQLLKSRSWRITQPLRAIYGFLKTR